MSCEGLPYGKVVWSEGEGELRTLGALTSSKDDGDNGNNGDNGVTLLLFLMTMCTAVFSDADCAFLHMDC